MITAFAIAVIVPIFDCIGIGLGIKMYYDKVNARRVMCRPILINLLNLILNYRKRYYFLEHKIYLGEIVEQ